MSFTIASVNVNGIRAACKQRNENNPGMNAWLETTPADVVLMQEVRALSLIHISEPTRREWLSRMPSSA